jgi:hypothetical protein
MPPTEPLLPAPRAETGASRARWDELLFGIAGLLPGKACSVLVGGHGAAPAMLAGRLAARVPTATVRCAEGAGSRPGEHWDMVIWVRTAPAGAGSRPDGDSWGDAEAAAGIVVDMHDPDWPVIRRVAAPPGEGGQWYLTETRAFFAVRAASRPVFRPRRPGASSISAPHR